MNGNEIVSYRNTVPPEASSIFSESDVIRLSTEQAQSYGTISRSYNYSEPWDDDVRVVAYLTSAAAVRDRLDVLGFGLDLARREFERSLDEGSFEDLITSCGEFFSSRPTEDRLGYLNAGPLDIFNEYTDDRVITRVAVEAVPDDTPVALDVTCLESFNFNGEYGTLAGLEEVAVAGPPIIITEGRFDSRILEAALRLLKPHLANHIRFLDYDTGAEGSAVAALRMLRSFAAAGVTNRVLAILDNDSAAREAAVAFQTQALPERFTVTHYPELVLANEYPTVGPQGTATMNVNGLAGSIELYLGTDTLRGPDGNLTPVQWRGYIARIDSYQGEVMNKSKVQKSFDEKMKAARSGKTTSADHDWGGLSCILDHIIRVLKNAR